MKNLFSRTLGQIAVLFLAAGLPAFPVKAQSTYGMHDRMILPVVVETSSYQSRIQLTNPSTTTSPSSTATVVDARFIPAEGTSQAASGPLECLRTTIPWYNTVTYNSLHELCPGLVGNANYGYLVLTRYGAKSPFISGASAPNTMYGFQAYSRVSNAAGIGFSVEAFPENAFTGDSQIVLGARRTAPTMSSPAYQTNCFVGTYGDFPANGMLRLRLSKNDTQAAAFTKTLALGPNRLVRILDVFKDMSGDATTDFDGYVFGAAYEGEQLAPAFMTFCTVQDNTSFGADFRIGKPLSYRRDEHRARLTRFTTDVLGRGMSLGPNNSQVFHLNFQVPDVVGCELIDPASSQPLTAANGAEIHLRWEDGSTLGLPVTGGGGAGQTAFTNLALGPKSAYAGANPGFLIVVQSTTTATAPNLNYGLVCRSGAGHSWPVQVMDAAQRVIQ